MTRLPISAIDCDGIDPDQTFAANSDVRIPSQKAVKAALGSVASGAIPATAIDADQTLAANSDAKVASQKATRAYSDTKVAKTSINTDPTMASNSDTEVPSVKATRTALAGMASPTALLATIEYLTQLDDWRAAGVVVRPTTFMKFG